MFKPQFYPVHSYQPIMIMYTWDTYGQQHNGKFFTSMSTSIPLQCVSHYSHYWIQYNPLLVSRSQFFFFNGY